MSPEPNIGHGVGQNPVSRESSGKNQSATKLRGRPPGDTTSETKKSLLHCAREVFAEYGYHGGTIAEIVRRAGVSTPVLYHHFGSKSGLFRAAVDDISELLLEARGQTVGSPGTLRENLDLMLRSAIDIHDTDPQLARFLLTARVESARDPELGASTEVNEYNFARLEGFRVLASESGVPPERAKAVAHACVALFGGLTVIAFSSPLDYDETVQSARLVLDSELFDS